MSWGQPDQIIAQAQARGLEIKPAWLRYDLEPARPGAGWEEFHSIWAAGAEKPDGLLVTDNVLFADALHALIELHVRVPDELLVVAHGCVGQPFWAPFPVVRLQVDPAAVAAEMAQLRLDLLATPKLPPRHRRLGYQIDDAGASRSG